MLRLLTVVFLMLASPAFTQGRNCAERERVLTQLTERYGETRQGVGLSAGNAVMEIFASLETGTWTITMTLPNGMMCLVGSGQSYEQVIELEPADLGEAL